MSEKPVPSAATLAYLESLGYEQLMGSTWRSTTYDVMVFVSIHENTEDRRVVGHLTKQDSGRGAAVKPYSQTYNASYMRDVDVAVGAVAEHMLLVAEEHAIAGTVKFQRYSGHADAIVVGNFA